MTENTSGRTTLRGLGVSDGLAMAPIRMLRAQFYQPDSGTDHRIDLEQSRFESATEEVRKEIGRIKISADGRHNEWTVEILESHLFFLEDPEFIGGVTRLFELGYQAEFAVSRVRDDLISMLEHSNSELMRERAADVRDICGRIIRSLRGEKSSNPLVCDGPLILAADDLPPLDALSMDPRYVKAVITEKGGPNGHSAIVARSLGIPAVAAVPGLLTAVSEGVTAVVDGCAGSVELNPAESRCREVARIIAAAEKRRNHLKQFHDEPGLSRDGRHLVLYANAPPGGDTKAAKKNGAEGVGLYRTEFLYMESSVSPDEDTQCEVYRRVLREMEGRPVIFRTLDAGGDKGIPYLDFPKEANPFLGLRGIRYSLERPDLFHIQLRALLRAGFGSELFIMFPMISVPDELEKARSCVEKAADELKREGIDYNGKPLLGMMVEVPSAALNADVFSRRADFFSIGTNDLIQYVMAADRMSPQLASLYRCADPAVLKLIDGTVQAAHSSGIKVSICGEAGSNPLFLPLLLGLGLDAISMNPPLIPAAKESLSRLDFEECRLLANECLQCGCADAAEKLLGEFNCSLPR